MDQKIQKHETEIALLQQKSKNTDKMLSEMKKMLNSNHVELKENINNLKDNVASQKVVIDISDKIDKHSKMILENKNIIDRIIENKSFWRDNWYKVLMAIILTGTISFGAFEWKLAQETSLKVNKMTDSQQTNVLNQLSKQINSLTNKSR